MYKRLNLLFSDDFVAGYIPKWKQLVTVFGKNGNIINISSEHAEKCKEFIALLQNETNRFRQKLLIYFILSYISELAERDETISDKTPSYVIDALSYINEHFHEKIIAADLAWKLGISRTTLMTVFKRYTGSTLNDYILHCRLNRAIKLLRDGKSVQETSDACGFGGTYGLIRAFKRFYNMTPKQYMSADTPPE